VRLYELAQCEAKKITGCQNVGYLPLSIIFVTDFKKDIHVLRIVSGYSDTQFKTNNKSNEV
jgi:hypothetical protein